MKSIRKITGQSELADYKNLSAEDGGGNGPKFISSITSAITGDFVMVQRDVDGQVSGLQEYEVLTLDGKGSVRPKPVNQDDEPDRVFLLMGLPVPASNDVLTLRVAPPSGADEVSISASVENFDDLRAASEGQVSQEEAGGFFTVNAGDGTFTTYINTGTAGYTLVAVYTIAETFDHVRFTLLRGLNM